MTKHRKGWLAAGIAAICVSLLQGCATTQSRRALYQDLAANAGWDPYLIETPQFAIAAASAAGRTGDMLIAYLEGDGRAYLDSWRPSADPTPRDPVALRMALADPRRLPIVYLARPCQYTLPDHGHNCGQSYWTVRRYSPEIIDSLGAALDREKQRVRASRVFLIGYSGGGALATLLAQRRSDVAGLITVAANLDLGYWTTRDHLGHLAGSLDPATEAQKLKALPQLHLAGGKDGIVGPDVTRAFLRRMPDATTHRLLVYPEFDHACCWAQQWRDILQRPEIRAVTESVSP